MRSSVPALLLAPLLACGAPAPVFRPSVAATSSSVPAPAPADVFAALKARDPGKLSALLSANPRLAGAHRPDGASAIAVALFTLNDDEETFVKPPANALLRALSERRPPLDVYDAAATGDLAQLRGLIANDPALVNAIHPAFGIAPLHFAAFGGDIRAVELLLASGATLDLPSRNKFHNTPLLLSVLADQYDAAAVLLAKGANVEATEEGGARALHLAAELGDARLLGLLLDRHASVDARTVNGETALAIASKRGHEEAARLLRERGAR